MSDTFSQKSSDAYLTQVVDNNLQAMLINDVSNTLNSTSTFAQCVALEIASSGGYSRKTSTLGSISGTTTRSAQASAAEWTAGTGMPTFNKVIWFSGATGSEIIHCIRETKNKSNVVSALTLSAGEKFSDQITVSHTGAVS